uniref:Metalloendopeptidase n=1 Tax=Romanomermis culicivorax TaxID=13658 RepID=A0A915IFI4_ROMCU
MIQCPFVRIRSDEEIRSIGTVVHEMGHALGLTHEHQRPDRDDYVEIMWQNILTDYLVSFEKYNLHNYSTLDLPFDYGSCMHYHSHGMSKMAWYGMPKQTIRTKKLGYQLTIGMKYDISFYDLKALHTLYCADRCSNSELTCERGGFLDTRTCEKCICPSGFTGKFCTDIEPYHGKQCGGVINLSEGRTYDIQTPKWRGSILPRHLPKGQTCTWLLKAPIGKIVELRIRGSSKFGRFFGWLTGSIYSFNIARRFSACLDYVEVKNSSDFANTGMRFCGVLPPIGPIYSETHEMMIRFRSYYARSSGFGSYVK